VTTVEGVNQMAVVSGVSDGLFGAEAGDGPYDPESGPQARGSALVAVKLNAHKELKLACCYVRKNAFR
jgi:hypothetical protein